MRSQNGTDRTGADQEQSPAPISALVTTQAGKQSGNPLKRLAASPLAVITSPLYRTADHSAALRRCLRLLITPCGEQPSQNERQ